MHFVLRYLRNDSAEQILGQIVYVPYGKLLILPAHTIHGGGYRTTPLDAGTNGNLRFHLYVARNQACLPVHQTNKYTEPNNKGKVSQSNCIARCSLSLVFCGCRGSHVFLRTSFLVKGVIMAICGYTKDERLAGMHFCVISCPIL
jgi:hypothetical protein